MVSNGNGSRQWTLWLAGILFTISFAAVSQLTANVIANDKDSRARGESIRNEFQACVKEQIQVNQKILITLAEIKGDIKYIKNDK